MHNPTNAAPEFRGRTHLGDYSGWLMEMDTDIGRIMDEIRMDFVCDGGGLGQGETVTLLNDGKPVGTDRVEASLPMFDQTSNVGSKRTDQSHQISP